MVFSHVKRLFHKHRYIGNAIFYTCLLSSADFFCQKIQYDVVAQHDFARTGRMAILGCTYYGPFMTFVYDNLDKALPGTATKTVLKKLVFDQFVLTTFGCCVFYVGISLLEGKSWKENMAELRQKFIPTYAASFMVWPTAQVINFALVPTAYRVVYISTVAFFWTVLLSYLKSKSELPFILKYIDDMTKGKEEKYSIEDLRVKVE